MAGLDEALALRPHDDGVWLGHADARYEAANGMFGGWTAALLLNGVFLDPRRTGDPASLTVNFLRAIAPGTDVRVACTMVGGGRTVQHWRGELTGAQDGRLFAHALVVTVHHRPTDGFTEPVMPQAPEPDTLPLQHPPGVFGSRFMVRPVSGWPVFGTRSTLSCHWVQEVSGRPVDAVQLALLADGYPPRIMYHSDGPRPSATLTLSVYFLATQEELEAVGDDYVLNEAVGTRGAKGAAGQQARLWSKEGALLATTEQLAWYQ